jgi:TonB family protein
MFRTVLASYSSKPVLSGGFVLSMGVHAAVLAAAVASGAVGDREDQSDDPGERVAVYLAPYPSHWRAPRPVEQQIVWRGMNGTTSGDDGAGGTSTGADEGSGARDGDSDPTGGLTIPSDVAINFTGLQDSVYFGFQVDNPAAMDATSAAPVYPDSLRLLGVEGEVIAQFVVDTNGLVESTSLMLLTSTHRLFSDAVRTALPGMRFRPAELGGQRIRQLVQVPFLFRLESAQLRANAGAPAGAPAGATPRSVRATALGSLPGATETASGQGSPSTTSSSP